MNRARKSDLLAKIARLEAENAQLTARDQLRDPHSAVRAIRSACEESEQEQFIALLMDARLRVIKSVVVALGTVSRVDVHPRDVFREAVRYNAHSVIVGHNHPSGVPEPSDSDNDLTERLVECGKILGIPVIDHLVVTRTSSYSYQSAGLM